jgi:hypothetical protein
MASLPFKRGFEQRTDRRKKARAGDRHPALLYWLLLDCEDVGHPLHNNVFTSCGTAFDKEMFLSTPHCRGLFQ